MHVPCPTFREAFQLGLILQYEYKSPKLKYSGEQSSSHVHYKSDFKVAFSTLTFLASALLLWLKGTGLLNLWGPS